MNKCKYISIILLFLISCTKTETVPIYDYYKNIPIIRGWTSDIEEKNYMIEVVLVYRENNTDLQTRINQLKPLLIDALRRYFSSLREIDFSFENQGKIKKEAVEILNEIVLESMIPKKADKIRQIKDLEEKDLLLDINIMQLQIFNLN
ncbi:MAG: hypothetical protein JXR64_13310 [Spirochaetales bacterium]|nr:hypothetical protein [Spirochaetales bacterium]